MSEASTPINKYAELRDWMEKTKAKDVETSHATVVEVSVTMTPLEAAKHLCNNKVLGAPVWDDSAKKYLGFFDVRDLLSTVIASHNKEEEKKGKEPQDKFVYTKWFHKKPMDTMPEAAAQFHVSYFAARNPFVPVTDDAPLLEVCRLSATRHAHRVPVIDATTGRCIRIISQATLVKFIAKNLMNEATMSDDLKKFFELHLTDDECTFPYKKDIVSAKDSATACEVFSLMDSKRLSGIAIVDAEDGAHVGSTNASDIRLAAAMDDHSDATFDLGLNILSYLAGARQVEPDKNDKYPMAHVKESSTLTHAIKMLAKTGMHRVFVVDGFLEPIGVVSVSDIIGWLTTE